MRFISADRIGKLKAADTEIFKQLENVGVVVDGQHYLAPAACHRFGKALVLRPVECTVVTCQLPIRRVCIKECVLAVVTLEAFFPRLIFDVDAIKPLLRGFQTACDICCFKSCARGGGAKMLVDGFAAKGGVLKIKKRAAR